MARKKKIRSITIFGRRWFHKGPGNTYNTAEIYVNGEFVHKTQTQYGYGDHYLDLANDWLAENGHIDNPRGTRGGREPLWHYCRDLHNIEFSYSVADVARKVDL